mmetsp:Transcript_106214/g.343129  ORF Transcript_106214/g.343129 Transcript_106214/m.343129 type:complete len:259 (+) Transcript_106214:1823-2599(+)
MPRRLFVICTLSCRCHAGGGGSGIAVYLGVATRIAAAVQWGLIVVAGALTLVLRRLRGGIGDHPVALAGHCAVPHLGGQGLGRGRGASSPFVLILRRCTLVAPDLGSNGHSSFGCHSPRVGRHHPRLWQRRLRRRLPDRLPGRLPAGPSPRLPTGLPARFSAAAARWTAAAAARRRPSTRRPADRGLAAAAGAGAHLGAHSACLRAAGCGLGCRLVPAVGRCSDCRRLAAALGHRPGDSGGATAAGRSALQGPAAAAA